MSGIKCILSVTDRQNVMRGSQGSCTFLLTLTILLSEYLQPSGGDASRVYDPFLPLPITLIDAAAGRRSYV